MFKRFLRDTKGNVALMSAVMAGPMIFAAAIGMDVAEFYRAKSGFQSAVDAAALAAAKIVAKRGDHNAAKTYGAKVFRANIANFPGSTASININTGNGDCTSQGIVATATLVHPMHFGASNMILNGGNLKKNGNNDATFTVSSTVQCGSDSVEIAMVLDNSGSMGGSKLTTLKSAARNMVTTLHASMANSAKPDPIKFALVPFSNFVNVGSSNRNASWMDTTGVSSIHHEHFDWSKTNNDMSVAQVNGVFRKTDGTAMTRFSLYDALGVSWRGCVEQRPYPLHTNDTPPTTGNPDSMYVPSFAPDAPNDYSNNRSVTVTQGDGRPYCVRWRWSRWYRSWVCREWTDGERGVYHSVVGRAYVGSQDYDWNGRYRHGGGITYGNYIQEETYYNNYLNDHHNIKSGVERYDEAHTGTGVKQYSRQKWMWKYFNYNYNMNDNSFASVQGGTGGPNAWCEAQPISPLTTSESGAKSAINSMVAEGGTNVQMGIAWGWRTLSSGEPFSQGRAESINDNKKIMIVMTDGNNTYYPANYWSNSRSTRNPAFYSSFGHNGGKYSTPLPRRLFAGYNAINPADHLPTYTLAMDQHMVETCTNAKAAGIQIYTIAFDVPTNSSVEAAMRQCASRDAGGEPLYYDADNSSALTDAFESIAEKIAELSITK